jgi:hypothetical protein
VSADCQQSVLGCSSENKEIKLGAKVQGARFLMYPVSGIRVVVVSTSNGEVRHYAGGRLWNVTMCGRLSKKGS